MGTTARAAKGDDAADVFVMVCDFATSYVPDAEAFAATFQGALHGEAGALLLAEEAGEIAGYVLASQAPTFFANGPVTEVLELYVKLTFRRTGVCRALVEQVAGAARDRGSVEVTVPTRRVGDFYRALGFDATAEFYKRKL